MKKTILLIILACVVSGCSLYKNHSVDIVGVGSDQLAVRFSTPVAESTFFRAHYHDVKTKDATRIPLYPIVDWHTTKIYTNPSTLNKTALKVAGDDARITLSEARLYLSRIVDPLEQNFIEKSSVAGALYFTIFDSTEIRYHANKEQRRREEKDVPTVEGQE